MWVTQRTVSSTPVRGGPCVGQSKSLSLWWSLSLLRLPWLAEAWLGLQGSGHWPPTVPSPWQMPPPQATMQTAQVPGSTLLPTTPSWSPGPGTQHFWSSPAEPQAASHPIPVLPWGRPHSPAPRHLHPQPCSPEVAPSQPCPAGGGHEDESKDAQQAARAHTGPVCPSQSPEPSDPRGTFGITQPGRSVGTETTGTGPKVLGL